MSQAPGRSTITVVASEALGRRLGRPRDRRAARAATPGCSSTRDRTSRGDTLPLQRVRRPRRARPRSTSARILDVDGYVVGTYVTADGERRQLSQRRTSSPRCCARTSPRVLIPNRIPTVVDQQTGKQFIGPLLVLIPALILVVVFVVLHHLLPQRHRAVRASQRRAQDRCSEERRDVRRRRRPGRRRRRAARARGVPVATRALRAPSARGCRRACCSTARRAAARR